MKRLFALLAAVLCLAMPATALAYSPFTSACDAGNSVAKSTATACSTNGANPITGSHGVLRKASTIVATIAAVAAVIIIMIGGLQYVLSNGDAQKAANARNAIVGAAIGLAIIVAAQAIVLFVLSRLN